MIYSVMNGMHNKYSCKTIQSVLNGACDFEFP